MPKKGNIPWNKGLKLGKMSEEHKRRIGQANKGRIGFWKGKKRSVEARLKMREAAIKHGRLPPVLVGEEHSFWKGEQAGYTPIHIWVARWKGKANRCEDCGATDKKRYDWSNIDHKYRRVLADYIARCRSCHQKYDIKFNGWHRGMHKPNLIKN